MSVPILSTKLFVPQITKRHIKREELLNKLIKSYNMDRQLTLVCAPAGYGKTTLVLELLSAVDSPCAWISLDGEDDDSNRFLSYFVASLKKAGIAIGNDVLYLVSDFNFNTVNIVLTGIINNITEFSDKVVLVLDDYHLIKSQEVNNIVKYILENQPLNLHMIITSREDPQFPLSRLRVNDRITEMRMGELCFSDNECDEFYLKAMDIIISRQSVEKITKLTEGWIAGMQLAGLLFKGLQEKQVEEVIDKFNGTHSYIIDYLVEEVLNSQLPEIREFLCKTSILERMNGELCDELTGKRNGRNLLLQLEKANLFLIPLDSYREWYRYHHLFADSLKFELSDEEEKDLYKKAAMWMMKKGFYYEAVNYALKSGDMKMSLGMVEDCTKEVFQNAQLGTLIKWLEHFSADMINGSEILSVRKSIAYFSTGKVTEAVEHLHSLGEDFERNTTPHNKGLIFSLKALIESHSGNDAEIYAREALNLLEPWDPIARTSMLNTLGKAQYFKGRTEEAVNTFRHAFQTGFDMGYTLITTLTLMNYGLCLDSMGQSSEAFKIFTEYMEGMTKKFGKPLPFIGIIYIALAELYYQKNDIAKSKSYMEEGRELCRSISYNWLVSSTTYAKIRFAEGEMEEAVIILDNMPSDSYTNGIHEYAYSMIGTLTQLFLRMGRLTEAEKYSSKLKKYVDDRGKIGWENGAVDYARLLIYTGKYDEAEEMLEASEKVIMLRSRIKSLITVLILLAVVFYKRGNAAETVKYISKAAEYAAQGEYIRAFLDEEPLVSEVLRVPGTSGDIKTAEFIAKVRKCFENKQVESGDYQNIHEEQQAIGKASSNRSLEFGEKLSERELEILTLIARGKSNVEIAKDLYITTNTTQWHISNIYSKLGVRSRTQAILKARDFEIL